MATPPCSASRTELAGFDLAVVGLGAAGAATLHRAAERGARVLGLDRFAPPHDRGSSHGESRIVRAAIGEGLEYSPLAIRALALWREIEAQSGQDLMNACGLLLAAAPALGAAHHGKPQFLEKTIEAARAFAVDHEVLDAAESRGRWPQLRLADHERAYFEPGAGYVRPEHAIAAQLELARRLGAKIQTGQRVLAIEASGDSARVTTDSGAWNAARVVVCAGAWTGALLGGVWSDRLRLYRQTMHWFAPVTPGSFAPDRFPAFIWMYGAGDGDWFYGMPADTPQSGVKIAAEQFAQETPDPEGLERVVGPGEGAAVWARHVAPRMHGLSDVCLRSAACAYTLAPDSRFMIGPDPMRENVLVVSACSGHGFKHSPAIGEALAAWALSGERPAILAPFSIPPG